MFNITYTVVYWENEERRKQGESDFFECDLNLEEAKEVAIKLVDFNGYACAEVREEDDEELAVFTYDGEE